MRRIVILLAVVMAGNSLTQRREAAKTQSKDSFPSNVFETHAPTGNHPLSPPMRGEGRGEGILIFKYWPPHPVPLLPWGKSGKNGLCQQ